MHNSPQPVQIKLSCTNYDLLCCYRCVLCAVSWGRWTRKSEISSVRCNSFGICVKLFGVFNLNMLYVDMHTLLPTWARAIPLLRVCIPPTYIRIHLKFGPTTHMDMACRGADASFFPFKWENPKQTRLNYTHLHKYWIFYWTTATALPGKLNGDKEKERRLTVCTSNWHNFLHSFYFLFFFFFASVCSFVDAMPTMIQSMLSVLLWNI